MLRAAIVVGGTFLYIVVAGILSIPVAALMGDPGIVYRVGVRGARLLLWLSGAKLVVEGRENLYPGVPCVYVANHVSNIDPPAIAAILPRVAVLTKKEVWKIPVFGRAMTMCKFIPVERGTERAAVAVNLGVERLKEGFSILAFPEGTRSRTEETQPFRHGVFLMAILAGAPVVPVTILGSREMMPKGHRGIRPGTIRFVAHPPVPSTGLTESDRGALADRVREIVISALPRGNQP